MKIPVILFGLLSVLSHMTAAAIDELDRRILLNEDWAIQSSTLVRVGGDTVSSRAFSPGGWYQTSIPATVLAALVENKVYPDPYFGMNLRSIPGTTYPIGAVFSNLPMPQESPFRTSWWYRKQFSFHKRDGEYVYLHFDGINFRANVWLNGRQLASSNQVAGAYRIHEFEVSADLAPTGRNVLALEVFAPEPDDLAINWVDWNPMPPDKNMGIWRDVYLTTTRGPVALRYPLVVSKLDPPALDAAHLTVTAELRNAGHDPVQCVVKGRIEKIEFTQRIELGPQETKTVIFEPGVFPQLDISQPRLWWPAQMGPQNLYSLRLEVDAGGKPSDAQTVRFGVREVTSELNGQHYRVFKINGKPIFIRGGGWAPDMLLRPSPQREQAELRYVKDMNLNAIRFEGKTETDRFLDICDREGILVLAGWCCCDHWEKWEKWASEDYEVSAASLHDQLLRLRHHASLLDWLYGSDNPPPPQVETKYLEILKATNWPNPYQSSASARATTVTGETGLKMTGPYEWVPPSYWYLDTKRGGAFGFNTETSPGPAVPPVESLRRMLPADHLWPIDDIWNFHAGGGNFKTIRIFTEALNARYGTATGVEDYAQKAQLMAYEGQRAMFEAYGRNKYTSTGVIQWMLNNAWPSLIWHLWDYYLRPGGGYFGTKKACEPIHIQYSYDDRSVAVVNANYLDYARLKATAKIYDLDMKLKWSQAADLDLPADGVRSVFTVPELPGLSSVYFLHLTLGDDDGKPVSTNLYWLATKPDVLDMGKSNHFYTPASAYADLTALKSLPRAELKIGYRIEAKGETQSARITLENPGSGLAFFIRLKITRGRGADEVLPILWEDNYFSLMPGEKREIAATFESESLQHSTPILEVGGWNTPVRFLPAP